MEPLCCHHLSLFFPALRDLMSLHQRPLCAWKRCTAEARQDSVAFCYSHYPKTSGFGLAFYWFFLFLYRDYRAISTARLNVSPRLHLRPIDVVVCDGPVSRPNLGAGFVLRCFQHLSSPDAATRRCPSAGQPVHRRSVQHGPLVLVPVLRKSQRPQQIETELSHDVLNPARVPL